MICEELGQEYGAYAIGAGEDPERSEIAAHLRRDCPVCTSGVRSALATVSSLAAAVKVADPPRRLRKRIIALVKPGAERSWVATLLPWALAAAMGIALVYLVPRGRTGSSAKLDQALSILNDPDSKDVSFGQPAARGRVLVSPGKGVVLIAAHLPPVESGKTFELWVIPSAGQPIPAGTFAGDKDNSAVYVHRGPVSNAAAVAVTVEPAGGSPLPTTKPFLVTKL